MGVAVPGSLGRSQEFAEAFRAKYYTVIKPIQDILADPLNLVLQLAAEWIGGEGLDLTDRMSILFKNLYSDMLKETGEGKPQGEAPVPEITQDPDDPDPDDPGSQQTQPNEPNEPG